MFSIEIIRLLITILLVGGGTLLFFFLRRNDPFQHLHMHPNPKDFLLRASIDHEAYQKKRTARRADLELRCRTAEEEEELLVMYGQDAHDQALKTGIYPEMVSITSPMMKMKNKEYHEAVTKKWGTTMRKLKDCPPVPFLTRTPNVNRWQLLARCAAAAKYGSLFCYVKNTNMHNATQAISYLLLRANTPNRWIHFEITHYEEEDLASIVRTYTDHSCGELIMSPDIGPILEFVWKPASNKWVHSL
jgi:hypothetical protein